jgi:hypothetical protein|nr:MAG TPA: hypothetical protein [Caudoviricetes sp.]
MGLNRLLLSKTTAEDNVFIMTMGQNGYQYGFSSYNNTFGEVEGNVQHDGKAVTLVMLCLYSSFLDFAFNVEGVTSGSYNVTIKITSMETNTTANIEFPVIKYQSFLPGFYEYTQNLTSDAASMFSKANVGKQFKVELIFN